MKTLRSIRETADSVAETTDSFRRVCDAAEMTLIVISAVSVAALLLSTVALICACDEP